MLIALHVGQIWNQFWWHHLVVKFSTNTSGTTYNWANLEPMHVELYIAGEITQVIDSIPWVRCASGNVLLFSHFDAPAAAPTATLLMLTPGSDIQ